MPPGGAGDSGQVEGDEVPGRAAGAWIADQLRRAGRRVVGGTDEPRVRPWSTVIRIPTDDGAVWFKANRAQTTYEPALMDLLAEQAPGLILIPLAIDIDSGWSLLPGGGPILRSLPNDAVLRHWERILPAYALLQRDVAACADELLRRGVPDQRPERMPGLLAVLLDRTDVLLLDRPDGLRTDELARLHDLLPAYERSCAVLAGSGIAATVDLGDLHDGNVFVRNDEYAVFDWGDGALAHPFASLLVVLSCIAHRCKVAPDAPELLRLRDAYLETWTSEHSSADLVEIVDAARAVYVVGRVLSWERALSSVPPADRGEYRDAVPGWLRELLTAQLSP